MKHGACELKNFYPPVEAERQNFFYAQLLLKDYAGPAGEFTALAQYFYQSYLMMGRDSAFADELRCISLTEMKHMKMLGELIVLLGGKPFYGIYDDGKYVFWAGYYISATENMKKFLLEDIDGEKLAIENYRKHMEQIDDRKVRRVLKRMIEDEEHHIEILNDYLAHF